MKYYILSLLTLIAFSGCSLSNLVKTEPKTYKEEVIDKVRSADYNQPYAKTSNVHQNLNGAIVAMADQLFVSNIFGKHDDTSIILTSFVDLNQFAKTTTFGRLLSESMFNELHIRNFKVTDFRGQNAVSVNEDGEFHITRNVDKLKDHISATEYIVVGTYVKFEQDSVLINARILDSETGGIISTARIIYQPENCRLFGLCPRNEKDIMKPADFGINIIKDNTVLEHPDPSCKDGICDK